MDGALDWWMDERQNIFDRLQEVVTSHSENTRRQNSEILAHFYATWRVGGCVLPDFMGLTPDEYASLCAHFFPGLDMPVSERVQVLDLEGREEEIEELNKLLHPHRADQGPEGLWLTKILIAACMGNDHLWQDLGGWSRKDLTAFMQMNFPTLAAHNDKDMKWKKFLYKQLCEAEGIYTCRSPSCEVCVDYAKCFAPEE